MSDKTELEILGEEINHLRFQLVTVTQQFTNTVGQKQEVDRWVRSEEQRLQEEFQAALNKVRNKRQELIDGVNRLSREKEEVNASIDEKNARYAKLLQMQSEKEAFSQLANDLAEICIDFPAYFKAHTYQHDDLLFIANAYKEGRNGILNANDMGLGKTFETTVALFILIHMFQSQNGRKPRIIWFTKKSLVKSSPKEIREWWPACKIITTENDTTLKDREFSITMALSVADIFLCNYEFARTTKRVQNIDWDFVVIDEVHKLKGGANSTGPTAIWESIKNICQKARFTLMLSGTPMVNRPQEMWSYLHIFAPERFPNVKNFERDFMQMKEMAGEMQLLIQADKLLKNALKGQMIRRRRDEVGLDLPEINREFRTLEMNPEQAKTYKMMRENFFVWLDSEHDKPLTATAIIAQLTRLRQINVWPAGIKFVDPVTKGETGLDIHDSSKVDEAMDIIEAAEDQVVIFSTFNEPLYEIKRRCAELNLTCEVLSGASVAHMGQYENDFQQKKIDVFCLNSSMGEGLNLQKNPDRWPGGSSVGVFLDLWWSPARNEQCEARLHRQGAKQPVFMYVLSNDQSIDAFIEGKIADKKRIFDSIMESDTIRPATEWRDFLEGVL
ncbi:chromatin remodeling complex ATPase-like protein [Caudoviricetes sp.]|nr:chromatin remodeling complex ATPase-like protein [Caudoviricetes sp.]